LQGTLKIELDTKQKLHNIESNELWSETADVDELAKE